MFVTKPVSLLNFYLNTLLGFFCPGKGGKSNTESTETYYRALSHVMLICPLPFAFMFKLHGLRHDGHVSRSMAYVTW